jgi:protein RecA
MSTTTEALAKALTAAIGTNDEGSEVRGWLDMGYPPLNKILSGRFDSGLPYGRIVEIFGPPSAGKTLLATLAMKRAQELGGIAGFCDHEKAFQLPFAERLGMNGEFPLFIYKQPKTWEQSNTMALKACEAIRNSGAVPASAPIVWVFDSVAAMIPKSVFEKGIDEYTMNDTTALARVTSTTLKSVNQMVGDLNATFVYLNQIRTKPGVAYGDPTTTPGGQAMEFYASIRLALGKKKLTEGEGKDKEAVGQRTGITTKKNKLTRPFQECDIDLRFDDDGMAHFDFTTGMIEALIGLGKLEVPKKGYVTWTDGKTYGRKVLAEAIDKAGSQQALIDMFPKPE